MVAICGVLYVLGGQEADSIEGVNPPMLLHTYSIASSSWIDLNVRTPLTVRWYFTIVAVGKTIYVFGGDSGSLQNDLHSYETESKVWTDLSSPSPDSPPRPRIGNGIAASGGMIYVFGGYFVDRN
eukprot:80651-Rhodomonas_salina.2